MVRTDDCIWRDNNLPGQIFPRGRNESDFSPTLNTLVDNLHAGHLNAPPRLPEWCRRCQGDEPSPFLWSHLFIVPLGELRRQLWLDGADVENRSGDPTTKQQQPRTLQVLNFRDPCEQLPTAKLLLWDLHPVLLPPIRHTCHGRNRLDSKCVSSRGARVFWHVSTTLPATQLCAQGL